MREQALRDWRKSNWLRQHMPTTVNLIVAVAAGAIGSFAA